MKIHRIPGALIMAMVLGIALAPVLFGTGAVQAGSDARVVFYVA
jgi:hypothetical protein